MSRKPIVVAVLVLIAGLVWFLARDGSPNELPSEREASSPAIVRPARESAPQAPRQRAAAAAAPRQPVSQSAANDAAGPDAAIGDAASGEPARPVVPSTDEFQRANRERTPPPVDTSKMPQRKSSVDPDAILNGINAAMPEVRDCYEQALKQDPSLAGKVVVEFDIEAKDAKGSVARGEVIGSETKSPFFEACVLQKVAGMEFPAPGGAGKVTVRYAFHFDPGGGFGGGETP